jgi:23S rRNA (cytosine1962-C5)-methyltransferase
MTGQGGEALPQLLAEALAFREAQFEARHETAFRLFNGFTEGCPDLAIDLYASTLLIHNYAIDPGLGAALVHTAQEFLRNRLPWLKAGLVKARNAKTAEAKRGEFLFGAQVDRKVREHGVWYAIDLTLNRDASLYLDTRGLRSWALDHLKGLTVLNTFAYTGSLGVAALAGGAARVVQMDRTRKFLDLAKTSCTLNGFPIHRQDFLTGDFWELVGRLKRSGARFDCAFIDPPFFAASSKGLVDQTRDSARLINKIRPLINDGGHLVAINNALFLSGREYMETLESLCADGYLKIQELIPVPPDFTGHGGTGRPITEPAPFNHSTKIAVLRVRRKKP